MFNFEWFYLRQKSNYKPWYSLLRFFRIHSNDSSLYRDREWTLKEKVLLWVCYLFLRNLLLSQLLEAWVRMCFSLFSQLGRLKDVVLISWNLFKTHKFECTYTWRKKIVGVLMYNRKILAHLKSQQSYLEVKYLCLRYFWLIGGKWLKCISVNVLQKTYGVKSEGKKILEKHIKYLEKSLEIFGSDQM